MVFEYFVNKNCRKFIYAHVLHHVTERNSHVKWSIKKDVFKKTHVPVLFIKASSSTRKETLLLVFSCKFAKFLRTPS